VFTPVERDPRRYPSSSISQDAVWLTAGGALLTQLGCAAIVTPSLRSPYTFRVRNIFDFIQKGPFVMSPLWTNDRLRKSPPIEFSASTASGILAISFLESRGGSTL